MTYTRTGAAHDAPLKLIALDADDLAVISAHVQDARVQAVGHHLAAGREAAGDRHEPAGLGTDAVGRNRAAPADRRAALRPGAGLQVAQHRSGKRRSPARTGRDRVLSGREPGGSALLMFSHGGALRLDVECLECELTDLGPDDLGTGDAGAASPRRRPRPFRGDAKRRALNLEIPGMGLGQPGMTRLALQGLTALPRRAIEQ